MFIAPGQQILKKNTMTVQFQAAAPKETSGIGTKVSAWIFYEPFYSLIGMGMFHPLLSV